MILAIDPGKHGGLAIGNPGQTPKLIPMPETPHDIVEAFESHRPTKLILEEVGGYVGGMGQPGSAMFTFGRNFGVLLGIAAALKVPTVLVRPQKWQKVLGLGTSNGMSKTEWKNKLKAKAQQLYPTTKITLDTSDACLIWHAASLNLL
jgi:hypothetical protein